MLNGQKLQGPATAEEVNGMLKGANATDKFPLFTAVHMICTKQLKPQDLVDQIRNHPVHQCVNSSSDNDFISECGSFIPDRIKLNLVICFKLNRPFHSEAQAWALIYS